jgi:hypothetical protein
MADVQTPGTKSRTWLNWFQQSASLIYLIAGVFLLYQNWKRFHRQSVFLVGIMFILYAVYRFFLVRRWIRRQSGGKHGR